MSVRLVDVRRSVHSHNKRQESVSIAVRNTAGNRYLCFREGANSQQSIVEWAAFNDQATGAFSLVGRHLQRASYVVATPHVESALIIEYGSPGNIGNVVCLLSGDGINGAVMSGEFLVHLHCAPADSQGCAIGGHLYPPDCIVGKQGLIVRVFCGPGFRRGFDLETGFEVFEPSVSEN